MTSGLETEKAYSGFVLSAFINLSLTHLPTLTASDSHGAQRTLCDFTERIAMRRKVVLEIISDPIKNFNMMCNTMENGGHMTTTSIFCLNSLILKELLWNGQVPKTVPIGLLGNCLIGWMSFLLP